jgi:amino acid transporter
MMPHTGGMYVYLREAYSPLAGFLYSWTLFSVIETGTIAAVAVAFARFSGVLFPTISEEHYLLQPIHISSHVANRQSEVPNPKRRGSTLITGIGLDYFCPRINGSVLASTE